MCVSNVYRVIGGFAGGPELRCAHEVGNHTKLLLGLVIVVDRVAETFVSMNAFSNGCMAFQ